MEDIRTNPVDEDPGASPETPEDVAVLYTWANVHGGKYRDFSASRREYRAQQRHRMVEAQREAELEAARVREEAAALELEEARRAEAEASQDSSRKEEAEELRRIAEEHAEQERLAAQRHVETAEELKRALDQAQREMEEARARAEEQAARYAEADERWRQSQAGQKQIVPGAVEDPYYFAGHLEPSAFAPGKGVRSSVPQRVSSESRITASYYRARDREVSDSGQYGVQSRRPADSAYNFIPRSDRFLGRRGRDSSGAREVMREVVETRIETPEDTFERNRVDELERLDAGRSAARYDEVQNDSYYDRMPLLGEPRGSSLSSGQNSAKSDLHIPPRVQQTRTGSDSASRAIALPPLDDAFGLPDPRRRRESATDLSTRTERRQRPSDAPYGNDGNDLAGSEMDERGMYLSGDFAEEHRQQGASEFGSESATARRESFAARDASPEWLVRNRAAEDAARERLRMDARDAALAAQQRLEAQRRAEDDRNLEEQRRSDELRVAEERLRQEAETMAAERHRLDAERRKKEEERERVEARRRQDEENLRAEETRRLQLAEQQRAVIEVQRRAEEQARIEAERRNQDRQRLEAQRVDDERRREAERQRAHEEEKAEEQRRLDESVRQERARVAAAAMIPEPPARPSQMVRAADGGINLKPLPDHQPMGNLPPMRPRSVTPTVSRPSRGETPMLTPPIVELRPDPIPESPVTPVVTSPAPVPVVPPVVAAVVPSVALPLVAAPVPTASDEPVAPTRPSTAGDTLQQSRERVAARWFALKGLMNTPGDVPQEAPAPRSKDQPTPCLSVVSLSGGVGKTSLVATLGRALSSVGEKVLLADTTPHGLLPYYFGARELRPDVVRTFSPPPGSADAPVYMVNYETDRLNGDEAKQTLMVEEIMRQARGTGRILLDLNGSSAWLARLLTRYSSNILVPIAPDMNSVLSIQGVDRFFSGAVDGLGRPVAPHYVLNQFDASLPLHLDVREVLRQQLGNRLLPVMIRRSPSVSEALAEGMTVIDYAPDSPVTDDYKHLAEWVRNLAAPATTGLRGIRWSEQ